MNKLQLAPSARLGGSGAYVKLDGTDELTGLYVHEIPPGLTLEPERHLYEEVIYVLSGQGRAEYWREDTGRIHLDWQAGQHLREPAEYLAPLHEHERPRADALHGRHQRARADEYLPGCPVLISK